MAGQLSRKRKPDEGRKGKKPRPVKKFKKQTDYNSSSGSEASPDFQAVNLEDSEEEDRGTSYVAPAESEVENGDETPLQEAASEEEITDGSESTSKSEDSDAESNPNLIRKRKRNDPEAFATSMSKILSSKLSTSKRSDPVLSRSVTALQVGKEINDEALERKAKHQLKEERRAALEKGRVKDVLGASTAFDAAHGKTDGEIQPSVAETMELEKKLRKTAQRGVVKLFNAVRAAQIKGEEAAREARMKGVVGQGNRQEKVNEMSKKGFLDLIAEGGGGLRRGGIEEG